MRRNDLDRLEQLADTLTLVFYVLVLSALLIALASSAGSGFLLLIIASCAYVGQASLGELVARERNAAPRPRRARRVSFGE